MSDSIKQFLLFGLAIFTTEEVFVFDPDQLSEYDVINLERTNREQSDELLLVHAIWRHGDRGPQNWYPNIPHQEEDWPFGLGELTATGMRQEFELGQAIKNNLLLNFSTIERNEMYIHSTDMNRTLMSALANLASTFPDGRMDIDEPGNLTGWPGHWRPIPVHSFDYDTDKVGNPQFNCPRRDQLVQQLKASSHFRKILTKYLELFSFLKNVTGTVMKVTDFDSAYYVQDYLLCLTLHNLPVPAWYTPSIRSQLDQTAYAAFNSWFGIGSPGFAEINKLSGGPLLGNMIGNMKMKLDCLKKSKDDTSCKWINQLKYFGLSAHDHTIWAFLATLGCNNEATNKQLPPYSASIGVQLWNITGVGPAVKLFYRAGAGDVDFVSITQMVTGCSKDRDYCPLDVFVRRSEPFIPVDIEKECKIR